VTDAVTCEEADLLCRQSLRTDETSPTLLVAGGGFAVGGIATLLTAVAHNLQDDAGFADHDRATRYTVGGLMLTLAITAGVFLPLRPEAQTVPVCVVP
jgi:hypothetical protein